MKTGISPEAFTAAAANQRKALVGYYPLGYPDVESSYAILRALCGDQETPGADLIEIGLPYSDPVMDGPVIQTAGTRALARGVRTAEVFGAVETVRQAGKPALVMTYWNLVERYGVRAFARDLANAGGAGLITPDLVPDEAGEWLAASEEYGLDRVFLVAPSSSDERILLTTEACRGWVYATAVMGVTGTRAAAPLAAPTLTARIRRLAPDALIGIGLGVSNGAQAAEVAKYADAVIVGSALLKPILAADSLEGLPKLREILADLVAGVTGATETAA